MKASRIIYRYLAGVAVAMLIVLVVVTQEVSPVMPGGIQRAPHSETMQNARSIALVMFQYSIDNGGRYPEGQSSTEVFQKLLDGKYISDPAFFYLPLRGKIKAENGQRLKSENVCWDVTCCADSHEDDDLPLVFMTGYRVDYRPGGTAVSLTKPYPPYLLKPQDSIQRLFRCRNERDEHPGIAVCYKSNSAVFLPLTPPGDDDYGTIPHFVPVTADLRGKTYRQLTPEGVLR